MRGAPLFAWIKALIPITDPSTMAAKRRAVIDIGTNSVKLLLALVDGGSVMPLREESEQTRLGAGFYESHVLQPEAIAHTARVVGRFANIAREEEATSVRVIATSAARDATNQSDLLSAIRSASGLTAEVISGEQEADWAFLGVRSSPAVTDESLLIVDVGGGSTEFILGHGSSQAFRQSFPLGTVRLLEQTRPADPPADADWQQCARRLHGFLAAKLQPVIQPLLEGARASEITLVGTGGTTSMLAAIELGLTRFDREKIEQTILSLQKVQAIRARLWSLSLRERQAIPGLPANRADVILFGAAIVEGIMDALGFRQLRVSTRGLRFGAVAAVDRESLSG